LELPRKERARVAGLRKTFAGMPLEKILAGVQIFTADFTSWGGSRNRGTPQTGAAIVPLAFAPYESPPS
jgi:hypothetical protein